MGQRDPGRGRDRGRGSQLATFFRYFPRKEDVLIEAVARHFREHVRATADHGLRDRRLRCGPSPSALSAPSLSPPSSPVRCTARRCSKSSPIRRASRRWSTKTTRSR